MMKTLRNICGNKNTRQRRSFCEAQSFVEAYPNLPPQPPARYNSTFLHRDRHRGQPSIVQRAAAGAGLLTICGQHGANERSFVPTCPQVVSNFLFKCRAACTQKQTIFSPTPKSPQNYHVNKILRNISIQNIEDTLMQNKQHTKYTPTDVRQIYIN